MSLMSISYDIIENMKIVLSSDDGTTKYVFVAPDDIVSVVYNHNGMRTEATGKVIRFTSDTVNKCECSTAKWVMILDASAYGGATSTRVLVDRILDITVVRKAADYNEITSPTGEYNVSNLRLVGNQLQLSVDNGTTWLNVCVLPAIDPELNDDDKKFIEKAKAILPSNLRPDVYSTLLKSIVSLLKQADESAKDNS